MKPLNEISTRAPEQLDKAKTKDETKKLLKELDALQNLLYACGDHSVLVILQGMDASGKDGAIRNVLGYINPQGVAVTSFKVPTEEELDHDFLWRIHLHAPRKGMIHVFNRSHYEDVLITRVHKWCADETAKKRFEAINDFEKLLTTHNKTLIFKFYLHISRDEQTQRMQERIDDDTKHWKYNPNDKEEAKLWDDYMKMYEEAMEHCNTVPWTIVPADQNWYKEFVIAQTITDGLRRLNMKYPALKES